MIHTLSTVMAEHSASKTRVNAFVPAIHDFACRKRSKTWMPATKCGHDESEIATLRVTSESDLFSNLKPGNRQASQRVVTPISMEDRMVSPTLIKERMEVVGSDGVHVGTVDHLEGRDTVKLTSDDPEAGGENHYIPLAWVDHVEMKVHLKQSGAEAKARWKSAH
jgi:hypothetical protein